MSFAGDAQNADYLDRVLARLIEGGDVYRLYHTPWEDASPEGKVWMKEYGFDDLVTLYVFDANGQTIQMLGGFASDESRAVWSDLPIYNKQWCAVPCAGGEVMGEFDASKVWTDDESDVVYKAVVARNRKYSRNEEGVLKGKIVIGPATIKKREEAAEEAENGEGDGDGDGDLTWILTVSFIVIGVA